MPAPSFLVSTWEDGLFHISGDEVSHHLAGQCVRGLTDDGQGGVLVIVDGHALRRRSADGLWSNVIRSEADLSCCVVVDGNIFVGTDDARILRIDADGAVHVLTGFDAIPGRGTWYAGAAIVDGKLMGPPLGIRSMTATSDGVLLANVHVGGIPRSTDGGLTWEPTIAVDADVHQVLAHPTRAELVIAAAAVGLCTSVDAGATWTVESRGLHAPHCSAVAFSKDHVYVSASVDPFSAQGAVYRRAIDSDGPLALVGNGFPAWTNQKVDTDGMAAKGPVIAMVDGSGRYYLSEDHGATWTLSDKHLPYPSGLHIC